MKKLFLFILSVSISTLVVAQDGLPGTWNQNTAYLSGDLVISNGNTYLAQQTVPSGTALTSTAYWLSLDSAVPTSTPGSAPTSTPDASTAPAATPADVNDTNDTSDTVTPGPYISSVNVRGHTGTADDERYMSFNLNGTANVMIRAVGPALDGILSNVMIDPNMRLTKFKNASDITAGSDSITEGDNDDYGTRSEKSTIDTEGGKLNPVITLTSKESATYLSLTTGYYSSQVFDNSYSASNGSKIGWVGVDMIGSDGSARFTSVSARGIVKPGDGAMFGGFEILGDANQTRKLFIRGRGPSFSGILTGLLTDPQFQLFKFTDTARTTSELVKKSDNYTDESNAAEIAAKGKSILGIEMDSNEPGVILDLSPGYYTIQFESVDGASGIGWIGIDDITE